MTSSFFPRISVVIVCSIIFSMSNAQQEIPQDTSQSHQAVLIVNRWSKDKIYSLSNYPYVAKEKNEGWYLESVDPSKQYYRFKHETSGGYLQSFLDSMYIAPIGNDPEVSIWKLERLNQFTRIAHVKTGYYLNTETGKLKLSKANQGWLSSHWKFEGRTLDYGANTPYSIINRWTKEKISTTGKITLTQASGESWYISNVFDGMGTVKLRQANGIFFCSSIDSLYVTTIDNNSKDCTWRIERYGDYYRIAQGSSENYLNNEKRMLTTSKTVPTWFSNQWILEKQKK